MPGEVSDDAGVALSSKDKIPPTICIDFDGVIADYSKGFQGIDVFGSPLPGARDAILELKSRGWKVIVFSCRPDTPALRKYLMDNDIAFDSINVNDQQYEGSNPGKPYADIYLDDRAIRFKNWGQAMTSIVALSAFAVVMESADDSIMKATNFDELETALYSVIPKDEDDNDNPYWDELNDYILEKHPKEYEASKYLTPSTQYAFNLKIWEQDGKPDLSESEQPANEKQAWQMTKEEYDKSDYRTSQPPPGHVDLSGSDAYDNHGKLTAWGRLQEYVKGEVKGDEILPISDLYRPMYIDHYAAVRKALREGDNVPPEVLAEYPDLTGIMDVRDIWKKRGSKPQDPSYRTTPENTKKGDAFTDTDLQGRAIELQFIRGPKGAEKHTGAARMRGYTTIDSKDGYDMVYMEYGRDGAGYYYRRFI